MENSSSHLRKLEKQQLALQQALLSMDDLSKLTEEQKQVRLNFLNGSIETEMNLFQERFKALQASLSD